MGELCTGAPMVNDFHQSTFTYVELSNKHLRTPQQCDNCRNLIVIPEFSEYSEIFDRTFCKQQCMFEYAVKCNLVEIRPNGERIPFSYVDDKGVRHTSLDSSTRSE